MAAPVAVGALGLAACVGMWFAHPETPGGPIPPCPLRQLFGIDCPGCGGSRMMWYFMHGDVPQALHYNAVALVIVLALAYAWFTWLMQRWRGVKLPTWHDKLWAGLAFCAVIPLWFVIRNLPFVPFTMLHV
ncbi:DUF2752 domain-containing protein [Segniliparus rotundus]|nr:DUF2752 domain-containing protein [Segniliparus rotundus]